MKCSRINDGMDFKLKSIDKLLALHQKINTLNFW